MAVSSTTTQAFSLAQIGEAFDGASRGSYLFQIPKFQRSLVWSQDQKADLVDSIFRGFPLGVLLAYETGESQGSKHVIQLVDGLQRVTAIVDYLRELLALMPAEQFFPQEIVQRLAQILFGSDNQENLDKTLERLHKWLRKTRQANVRNQFHSASFISGMALEDGAAIERLAEISTEIDEWLYDAQKKLIRIENTPVPISLFSGDASEIPVIFERINNRGADLTKYEILASTWVDTSTEVSNKKIRAEIENRFRVLLDKGYEISGVDGSGHVEDSELNLFDYLSGLGGLAHDAAPSLFGTAPNQGMTSPIGFVAAAVAHGLRISNMERLPGKFLRGPSGRINPEKFEVAFLESVEQVQSALEPYLSLRLNKKKTSVETPLHSQNQIISLVVAYMTQRFKGKDFVDQGVQAGEQILAAAPAHYLSDVVSSLWKGSGDSRLFDTVWAQDGTTPSSHYQVKPQVDSVRSAIDAWNQEQMEKRQKARSSYPAAAKAFLKFAYSDLVSVKANKAVEFEIEHIFPVARLAAVIPANDEGWPISAPGNLMILPGKMNRIKGKHFLGDILPELLAEGKTSNAEVQQIQDSYLISPAWNSVKMAGKLSRPAYERFVDSRFKVLQAMVLKNLGYKN